MIKVLILAAGNGTRWENYRGTPKHRLLIEEEVLIERTYRQFSKYTDNIIIVCNDGEDTVNGAQTYIPPFDKSWKDIAKFWSSRDIWSSERNVLVFADVYFTDEAVETIMNDKADLSFYLRDRASEITGKPWKEIWGIGFNGKSIPILDTTIRSIIESSDYFNLPGGWCLYEQLKTNKHSFDVVKINDWTEDFDLPRDIDNWEINRQKYRQ